MTHRLTAKKDRTTVLTILSDNRRELIGLAEIECPLIDTAMLTNFGCAHFCGCDFTIAEEFYETEPPRMARQVAEARIEQLPVV